MPDTPNIIVLLADQLRQDFLSCYGASFIDTPNIDWIADHGVRYDRAYSASPLCVPARVSMLTGMGPWRHGVLNHLHALRTDHEAVGIRTWPQLMAARGYYTAAVGKTHFFPWNASHGFQHRVACEDKMWPAIRDDYYHYLRDHGFEKPDWRDYGGYLENQCVAQAHIPWEHSCDRYTGREACRFIDSHGSSGPFALFVGFPSPHDPYDPPPDFPHRFDPKDMPAPIPPSDSHGDSVRRFSLDARMVMGMDFSNYTEAQMRRARAEYAALVKQVDEEVGTILDALRRNALVDDTVIVLTSDHGDHLGDHGIEGKRTFYEASARIPLVLSAPGGPRGAVCPELVELRDVTATALRYGGCDLPGYMDAQPLPELGLDDGGPRDCLFGAMAHAWMVIKGAWKLCKYSGGETMLFNLNDDPQEQRNLIGDLDHFDVYRELDARLCSQVMADHLFAMHDRLASPGDLAISDDFGHEGWSWSFPSPASWARRDPRDVSR